jgi:beta-N-acetylhexosaminidase
MDLSYKTPKRRAPAAPIAIACLAAACAPAADARQPSSVGSIPTAVPSAPSGPSKQARELVEAMSLEDKCAQLLMIGVEGTSALAQSSRRFLERFPAGGVVLFSFNVPRDDVRGLAGLTGGIQDALLGDGDGIPAFIAIDHEGGSVFRFARGVTRLPAAQSVGSRPDRADYARALGEVAALELRALGVTMNLAPVVEASDARSERFLRSRAYSSDPIECDEAAGAFIEGMSAKGLPCAIKHFPGNAEADPHRALPVIPLGREEARSSLFARFASAIRHAPAAVMLSHAMLPSWDAAMPATLSATLVTEVLKRELGFSGIALTDDVMMKGLTADRSPEEAAVLAVLAGCDMLMVTGGSHVLPIRDALVKAVREGRVPEGRIDDAVARIVDQKLRYSLWDEFDADARATRLKEFPRLVAANAESLKRFAE